MDGETVRINVAPHVYAELQRRADERDLTVGELVKRAVALYRYVAVERDGQLVADIGGKATKVMLDATEADRR